MRSISPPSWANIKSNRGGQPATGFRPGKSAPGTPQVRFYLLETCGDFKLRCVRRTGGEAGQRHGHFHESSRRGLRSLSALLGGRLLLRLIILLAPPQSAKTPERHSRKPATAGGRSEERRVGKECRS